MSAFGLHVRSAGRVGSVCKISIFFSGYETEKDEIRIQVPSSHAIIELETVKFSLS